MLFHEGDPATYLAIIVRGEVNIQYLLGNGEFGTVDTLIAGNLRRWSATLSPTNTRPFAPRPRTPTWCDWMPPRSVRCAMRMPNSAIASPRRRPSSWPIG